MIIGCVSLVEVSGLFVAIRCPRGRGVILPGGKWERGETFRQAAARELREETGLRAVRQDFLFFGADPNGVPCYTFRTWVERFAPVGSPEGEVVLATWGELLQSEYAPYYDVMYEVYDQLCGR